MWPWHFWVSQGPKHLSTWSPVLGRYDLDPAGKTLYSAHFHVSQTKRTPLVPSLPGFIFLPACRIKQTNSILLKEPGNNWPSCYYKACLPQPLFVHSAIWHNPCVVSFSPRLYMWWINCCLSNLSSIGCHVLNISHYLWWRGNPFLSSVEWMGSNQNTHVFPYSYYLPIQGMRLTWRLGRF